MMCMFYNTFTEKLKNAECKQEGETLLNEAVYLVYTDYKYTVRETLSCVHISNTNIVSCTS